MSSGQGPEEKGSLLRVTGNWKLAAGNSSNEKPAGIHSAGFSVNVVQASHLPARARWRQPKVSVDCQRQSPVGVSAIRRGVRHTCTQPVRAHAGREAKFYFFAFFAGFFADFLAFLAAAMVSPPFGDKEFLMRNMHH